MEKWDVYDIHKNRITDRGTIESTDELKAGEYNLVTVSWICNSKGEFLMQKRAANKKYPLVYANHGGRAQAGETSKKSMIRELFEEIGIIVDEDELTLLRTFHDDESIFDEYILKRDLSLQDLVIDQNEVEYCVWFSLQELSNAIDTGVCFDYKHNHPNGVSSFTLITNFTQKAINGL